MKIYVLVRDNYYWQRFFTEKLDAYTYMRNTLKEAIKNDKAYENVRTYGRNGRLHVKAHSSFCDTDEKFVYQILEITVADALNYLLANDKFAASVDFILNGSEYKGSQL